VAALALVLTALSMLSARGAAKVARESRETAERSAQATVASAAASARSAGAAEASATHSARSAVAAERSAAAHERAIALAEAKALAQAQERLDRDAPRWGGLDGHDTCWRSDKDQLSGVLVNKGRTPAQVTGIELRLPNGGALVGRYRAEPQGPGGGGFVSTLLVSSGGGIYIEFQTTDGSLGQGLNGSLTPCIRITARNDELGWEGTRRVELQLELAGATFGSDSMWQPRPVD
jgi:hypothetical protein